MDKKTFIEKMSNDIGIKTMDPALISNLYDKFILAEKTGRTVYSSEFYQPNIWSNLIKMKQFFDVDFTPYGIFDDAERRIVGIGNSEFLNFPVRLIKIKADTRFTSIEHKDYLGSIMSTGIKRGKLGDLLVDGNVCYVAAFEDTAEYLLCNLAKVKNSSCKIELMPIDSLEKPEKCFEIIDKTVTSLRIDCLTAGICGISRAKSDEMIKQGKVFLNYSPVYKKDTEIRKDDVVVVRGYGKFIFNSITGSTGSGRLKIELKKYI